MEHKKFNPHEYAIEAGKMSARELVYEFQTMVRSFTYLEYRLQTEQIPEIHFKMDILKREIIDRLSYIPPSSF